MTATPDLEQTRHLATELPGPRSRELAERQKRAVPAGVATTMPVYAARAAGGILEDVDGNRLIDLASGIAVTSVGASHPRVVAAVQEQVAQFTHTSFMITPYEGYVAVAEQLDRTAPISERQRTMLDFAAHLAAERGVLDDAWQARLEAQGFSLDDIWDIGAIAGLFGLSNRLVSMARTPPNDEFYLLGRVPRSTAR